MQMVSHGSLLVHKNVSGKRDLRIPSLSEASPTWKFLRGGATIDILHGCVSGVKNTKEYAICQVFFEEISQFLVNLVNIYV